MTIVSSPLNSTLSNDEFTNLILQAKQEIKDGKVLIGNLDKLAGGLE